MALPTAGGREEPGVESGFPSLFQTKETADPYDDGLERSMDIEMSSYLWQSIQDGESPSPIRYASHESPDIQPVTDLKSMVMQKKFRHTYAENIIDLLCLAIEKNPDWLGRYENLVLHYSQGGKKGKDIVNSTIGFYTKDLTGMVNMGEGQTAKSRLIQSYSKLG